MMKKLKYKMMVMGAATFTGLLGGVENAYAGNTFVDIIQNVEDSIRTVPGLISGVSYMMGILLAMLGILKIKDHVENPSQTPLQQGAIRLAAGGALFALPIVSEAMLGTIGEDGTAVEAPAVNALEMQVQ